jgi:hypothetical protein
MHEGLGQNQEILHVEETDVSPESLQLAKKVVNLIYEDCQDGWYGETNPEPVSAPYREIPKFRILKQKSLPQFSVRDFLTKLANTVHVVTTGNSDVSKDLVRPDLNNRGWRIIVQREKNGNAVIFYSGEIPNLHRKFTQYQEELKVFLADTQKGLSVGFIDEIQTPNDNQPLSTLIYNWTQQGGNWRQRLKPYDSLSYGDQVATRGLLGEEKHSSPVFTAIRSDFLLRSLILGGEFLSR